VEDVSEKKDFKCGGSGGGGGGGGGGSGSSSSSNNSKVSSKMYVLSIKKHAVD
jgi:hypothetical protein